MTTTNTSFALTLCPFTDQRLNKSMFFESQTVLIQQYHMKKSSVVPNFQINSTTALIPQFNEPSILSNINSIILLTKLILTYILDTTVVVILCIFSLPVKKVPNE